MKLAPRHARYAPASNPGAFCRTHRAEAVGNLLTSINAAVRVMFWVCGAQARRYVRVAPGGSVCLGVAVCGCSLKQTAWQRQSGPRYVSTVAAYITTAVMRFLYLFNSAKYSRRLDATAQAEKYPMLSSYLSLSGGSSEESCPLFCRMRLRR